MKTYGRKTAFRILLCVMLSGCGNAGENLAENAGHDPAESAEASRWESAEAYLEETEAETAEEQQAESPCEAAEPAEDSPQTILELPDAYQQMAMYIQEGFRKYQVEGDYQAYFCPVEDKEGSLWVEGKYLSASENTDRNFFSCNILLESQGVRWKEELRYEYDAEADWYVFASQYEPVFSKDLSHAEWEDSDYVEDVLENYVYRIPMARDADIAVPIRYTSENGPTQQDERIYYPWTFREGEKKHDYYVEPMAYSYRDERLDINIVIQYVQVDLHDGQEELEEAINAKLREAFFYDDWEEAALDPGRQIYSDIDRLYKITREDERYLSMRVYEYGCARWNAHPGEGEIGITIDMRTGEAVRLEDVVGKEYTPKLLFESGAFQCMWGWEGDDGDYWIGELKEEAGDDLSSYDDRFYLTDTGVGLITYLSRYYTNLEASYEDLGLEGF